MGKRLIQYCAFALQLKIAVSQDAPSQEGLVSKGKDLVQLFMILLKIMLLYSTLLLNLQLMKSSQQTGKYGIIVCITFQCLPIVISYTVYSYFNLRCQIKASSLQDKTEGEYGILIGVISVLVALC